ncbi:type II toxin-antitoxin system VapC family toxin [Candidatus Woesearchaeota archaeon]|nr:type II toxin-antitoxin system VapC family toxin [Candidatus Woesearchaeota archaeon]
MLFIDSNIWCYYFDESSKEHIVVSKYIEKILDKEEIVINNLIIIELSHYLIKNLGSIKGQEKIKKLLAFPFIIEDFNYDLLITSIDLLAQYNHTGIGGRDATILATMKRLDIKKLLTHDKSFKKIDFIEVIDPLE